MAEVLSVLRTRTTSATWTREDLERNSHICLPERPHRPDPASWHSALLVKRPVETLVDMGEPLGRLPATEAARRTC